MPDLLPPIEQTGPTGNRQSADVNRNQHFPNSPTFPVSRSTASVNGIEAHSVPISEQSGFSDSLSNQQSNGNRNQHFPNSPTFPTSRNTETAVNIETSTETNFTRPVYPASAQQHTFSQPMFGRIIGVCPTCRVSSPI